MWITLHFSKVKPLNICKSLSEKIGQKKIQTTKKYYKNKEEIKNDNVIPNIANEQEKPRI